MQTFTYWTALDLVHSAFNGVYTDLNALGTEKKRLHPLALFNKKPGVILGCPKDFTALYSCKQQSAMSDLRVGPMQVASEAAASEQKQKPAALKEKKAWIKKVLKLAHKLCCGLAALVQVQHIPL